MLVKKVHEKSRNDRIQRKIARHGQRRIKKKIAVEDRLPPLNSCRIMSIHLINDLNTVNRDDSDDDDNSNEMFNVNILSRRSPVLSK